MEFLICPACGSRNVHHTKVEIFDRKEDMDGLHVTVQGVSVKVDTDFTDNPSLRRGGLVIHFTCEECTGDFECNILQHKGQTVVDMKQR